MIAVCGGVGLRILRAIALAIQPELFIPDQLSKGLKIFHGLLGAKIWKEFGTACFIRAICCEGAGSILTSLLLFARRPPGMLLVKLRCSHGASQSTGQSHPALVEEYNVKSIQD